MLLFKCNLAKNKNMAQRRNSRSNSAGRKSAQMKRPALMRKSRFFLPWPFIAFILISIGVLLVGWTFQAEADDLHVTAKVSAELPSGPAIITSPGDGTRFSEVPITVSGTCPVDTYVQIYRNNFFSGTAICTTDGNFTLDIDLFAGANQLEAKVFNITDDEGPASTPITVYYDVPEQPTGGTPAAPEQPTQPQAITLRPPSSPAVAPFSIKSEFAYRGYKVGQTVELVFEVGGGVPPYALNIDWGDGTNSVISQKEPGKVSAYHRYKKVGNGTKGSFVVRLSGSDTDGRQAFLQLFLLVNPAGVPGFVANTLPSGPHFKTSWLKLIWPAYIIILLMAFSFWLGEREEFIELKNRGRLRRRHP
jgi:hypothetical protein